MSGNGGTHNNGAASKGSEEANEKVASSRFLSSCVVAPPTNAFRNVAPEKCQFDLRIIISLFAIYYHSSSSDTVYTWISSSEFQKTVFKI